MELPSCNKLKEIQLTLKLNKQNRLTSVIAELQYVKGNPTDVEKYLITWNFGDTLI